MLLMQTFFPPPPPVVRGAARPTRTAKARAGARKPAKRMPRAAENGAERGSERPTANAHAGRRRKRPNRPKCCRGGDTAHRRDRPPESPTVPQQWLTLGPYAATSPYQLMVTLTNRGAAIERVELVERRPNGQLRYRDLDSQSRVTPGLHCRDTADGCVVSAVGPGTPAALAQASEGGSSAGYSAGRSDSNPVDGAAVGMLGWNSKSWLQRHQPRPGRQRECAAVSRALTSELIFRRHLGRPTARTDSSRSRRVGRGAIVLAGSQRLGTQKLPRGRDELSDLPSLRTRNWELLESTDDGVAFRFVCRAAPRTSRVGWSSSSDIRSVPGKTAGRQRRSASAHAGYNLQMSIEIEESGHGAADGRLCLDGPNGLPIEGWWYSTKIHPSWGSAGARDVIWRVQENKHSLRSAIADLQAGHGEGSRDPR